MADTPARSRRPAHIDGGRPHSRPATSRRATIVLATLAVALTGVAACSDSASPAVGGATDNTATIALGQSRPNYILPSDPACSGMNNHNFRKLMYGTLYTYGGDPKDQFALNPSLSLAKPPSFSHGNKQVTVTLKDYQWSDGKPVTAKDIVFYLDLLKANRGEWGCYSKGSVPDNLASWTVKDDKTIVLHLTRAYAPGWFTSNALATIQPFPWHAWSKTSADGKVGDYAKTTAGAKKVFAFLTKAAKTPTTYDSNPLWKVVNGPWQLAKFDLRGDVVFTPNKKYSGPDKPHLDKLIERPFTTPQAEFNALVSGDDITVGYIPSENASRKNQIVKKGYKTYRSQSFGINYIVLNFNSNEHSQLFRQLYIRQALQLLIDEPTYTKVAYEGAAISVKGPIPIKPDNPYAGDMDQTFPYEYNPARAKKLLEQHGWTVKPGGVSVCARPGNGPDACGPGIAAGEKLTFNLTYVKSTSSDRAFATFQSAAGKVGVKVNIRGTTFDQAVGLVTACKKGTSACRYDAVTYGGWFLGSYPSGEDLFMSGSSAIGNYNDPKADALINATEYQGGKESMKKYQEYITEQLPVLWIPWTTGGLNVVSGNLRGFERDMAGVSADIYPQYWKFAK